MISLFKGTLFLLIASTLLFSCKEENKRTNTIIQSSDTSKKKSINKIGELLFRISYSGHDTMSNSELEKLLKSNPWNIDGKDSRIKKLLEAKGLIKEDELLLSKFKITKKNKYALENKTRNKIKATLNHDGFGHYKLFVQNGNQSDSLTINNLGDLYFKIEDIIPGGFEELIIIVKYYIMNGDNFVVGVYEFK